MYDTSVTAARGSGQNWVKVWCGFNLIPLPTSPPPSPTFPSLLPPLPPPLPPLTLPPLPSPPLPAPFHGQLV